MENDFFQNLIDGDEDIRAFSSFWTLADDVMIKRRLSPDIHSMSHYLDYLDAIKLVFTQASGSVSVGDTTRKTVQQAIDDAVAIITKSGGHVGYETLADAQADSANITAKTIVEITNDTTANNGVYLYDGTNFTKSSYDPTAQAKAYADTKKNEAVTEANSYTDNAITGIDAVSAEQVKDVVSDALMSNSADEIYKKPAFSEIGGYNSAGKPITSAGYANNRRTTLIAVKSGAIVTVTTAVYEPAILVFDTNKEFVESVASTSTYTYKTYTYTATQDGYIASQYSSTAVDGDEAKIVIENNRKLFVEYDTLAEHPALTQKADKSHVSYITDFTQGEKDINGDINAIFACHSPKYKFAVGTVITLSSKGTDYRFGYTETASGDVEDRDYYQVSQSVVVTVKKETPYLRFQIKRRDETQIDIADALANVTISYADKNLYMSDIEPVATVYDPDAVKPITVTQRTKLIMTNYRMPSRATGGVLTIIDDDGRTGLEEYHQLYKSKGLVYGMSVSPGNLDKVGYLTERELAIIANDVDTVELCDHSWTHDNLSNLTPTQIRDNLNQTTQWFESKGYSVGSYTYPNGGENDDVRRIVQQYYPFAFHYGLGARINSFASISNASIKRLTFSNPDVAKWKQNIDNAIAQNGWLVITTHYNQVVSPYWAEGSLAYLNEVLDYAIASGIKVAKPSEGFQIFGNIAENDTGWKRGADGVEYVNGVAKT